MYLVIELSNVKIKATLVNDKTRAVKHYVAREIPEGLVQNGYIIKPEELENQLRALLMEFPKVKGCVFLLNTTDLFEKELTTPVAKPAAVKTVVQNQMGAVLGAGKDYSIDYMIRDTIETEEGSLYRVFAYAVPVTLLQSYMAVAQRLQIKLLSIDVKPSALNKALKGAAINNIPLAGTTVLLMKLGYKHLDMSLIENEQCIYSRTIDFDTQEYREMIRQFDPGADFTTISLNPLYKQQFGRIQEMLDPMTGGIVDEIFRLQQYTYSRANANPISNVFVYGPLTSINGLTEYLNANIDIPVHNVESVSTLYIDGAVYPSDVLIASGAADIKGVNLATSVPGLFDDVKGGSMTDILKINVPIIAGLLVIILGVFAFLLIGNNNTKAEIKSIKDEMNSKAYMDSLAQYESLNKSKTQYTANRDNIQNYFFNFTENNLFQKSTVDSILAIGQDVELVTLNYAPTELTLFCRSTVEYSAPNYAIALRDTLPAVKYVVYSGEKLEIVGEEKDSNGNVVSQGEEYYTYEIVIGLKDKVIEPESTETQATETTAAETTAAAN